MKKLRLKALSLGAREILSREQLRVVMGGGASASCNTSGNCPSQLWDSNGCCVGGSGTNPGGCEECYCPSDGLSDPRYLGCLPDNVCVEATMSCP